MKKATSSGSCSPSAAALAHQDGHAGFQFGRLDGHGQSPAETRFQAFLKPGHFLRVPVAGEDDAALTLKKCVECVKELLLGSFLAGKQLYVVDQERIQGPVMLLERVDGVFLEAVHHMPYEVFRLYVHHLGVEFSFADQVADGMHEVRLAQPHTTVDAQRVIGSSRGRGHLDGTGSRQLVALALDEVVEGEIRIQPAARHGGGAPADRRVGDGRGFQRRSTAADLQIHGQASDDRDDVRQTVLANPVDHEPIGRQQAQATIGLYRLQRAYPRVEFTFRQLQFQCFQALVPE